MAARRKFTQPRAYLLVDPRIFISSYSYPASLSVLCFRVLATHSFPPFDLDYLDRCERAQSQAAGHTLLVETPSSLGSYSQGFGDVAVLSQFTRTGQKHNGTALRTQSTNRRAALAIPPRLRLRVDSELFVGFPRSE